MADNTPIIVYTAECIGNAANCLYPNEVKITDAVSAKLAFATDMVCARYKNNYRNTANFEVANALPGDCDNDHSDEPADWVTPEDIADLFADVSYVLHYSRHHMKPKGEKSARPRFHIVFLIDPERDADRYTALKQRLLAAFPFFDANAMDAARFLYSMPKSTVGSRSFSTEPIPEGVRVRYQDLIEAILSSDNEQQPISLDDGAEEVLETLFNEVEGRLKGDLAEIPDWAGKFVGSVLRISGILHIMKYPKNSMFDSVDKATMENAVTIGRYFLEHAKAAYSLMGADAVNKNAQYLLSAIKRERLTEFSRRDAMRLCRRFKTAESLQPVLDRLCEYGYLAAWPLPPAHGAGRKPSEIYLTNPAVLEDGNGEGRS